MGRNDNAALEDAGGVAVDNGLERLAAIAMGRCVVDRQRRVGVLLAAQQAHAAQRHMGMLARIAYEYLMRAPVVMDNVAKFALSPMRAASVESEFASSPQELTRT